MPASALVVFRETLEAALIVAIVMGASRGVLAAGAGAGLAAGVLVGVLLYRGLLRIPLRHFFMATGLLVLLLAAGLAAAAAAYLTQAGLLPPISEELWDSSGFLSVESVPGHILHVLIGYQDRPTGIQLVFYVATLVTIAALMGIVGAQTKKSSSKSELQEESCR
ncbi:MAG: hypothetical protein A3G27_12785 [Betaproteobacteria bacterium RIFCSPLOWO2_12_FULL_66_14]|nr:MAG: hypothetical protein A3G27_12785 [Betaproteobacteria bacterium RIFCSPLOWO2_12_FULL_66_14]